MATCRSTLATVAALMALGLAAFASYTVEPGDTLSGIAVQHRTSLKALVDHNGITDPHRILAGQVLRLPGAATAGTDAAGASAAATTTHTVVAGETLSAIAARYGVNAQSLAEANSLADANLIREGQRLALPGAAAAAATPAAGPSPSSRGDVGALIEQIAQAHGWNPAFVKALAWQESGWNNGVVSSAGAVGIMQVLPSTGEFVSENLAGRTLDLANAGDNILAGVLFLDYLHRLTGGDVRLILGGYFQGLYSMRINGVYTATERYIDNVLALRTRFA